MLRRTASSLPNPLGSSRERKIVFTGSFFRTQLLSSAGVSENHRRDLRRPVSFRSSMSFITSMCPSDFAIESTVCRRRGSRIARNQRKDSRRTWAPRSPLVSTTLGAAQRSQLVMRPERAGRAPSTSILSAREQRKTRAANPTCRSEPSTIYTV